MDTLRDAEFGDITIRRSSRSRYIRLAIDARGTIRLTLPNRASVQAGLSLLNESRPYLRKSLAKIAPVLPLRSGELVGKTHKLVITEGGAYSSRLAGTELHVALPSGVAPESATGQSYIRQACLKALRTQSRAFLSRRLALLAGTHGFTYQTVRFSNAGTRWGSCSSRGTISLNIWLMQLPFELIDYVIIHELCHTKQMNHSPQFWTLVETLLPDYRTLRRTLKTHRPA